LPVASEKKEEKRRRKEEEKQKLRPSGDIFIRRWRDFGGQRKERREEAKKKRREAEVAPFGRSIKPPAAGKKRAFKAHGFASYLLIFLSSIFSPSIFSRGASPLFLNFSTYESLCLNRLSNAWPRYQYLNHLSANILKNKLYIY